MTINIKATAENYENYRAKAGKRADRIKKPSWCGMFSPIRPLFRKQKKIFRKGTVVAGALVQANNDIFEEGNGDRLACVVYSPDPYYNDNQDNLRELAESVYALKGLHKPAKEIKKLSRILTNETTQAFRMPIPTVLTDGREAFYTTILISRRHLPGNRLQDNVFPMLIAESGKPEAIVLPCSYWMVANDPV